MGSNIAPLRFLSRRIVFRLSFPTAFWLFRADSDCFVRRMTISQVHRNFFRYDAFAGPSKSSKVFKVRRAVFMTLGRWWVSISNFLDGSSSAVSTSIFVS